VKVRRKQVGEVDILSFEGEFDASTVPAIEAIDGLVEEGRTRLVFSFAGLTFVASPVLGYFVKIGKRLRDMGGGVVFSRPSPFMQATIRTLGLDQIFDVFADDNAAVRHFQGARGTAGDAPPRER